MWHQKPLKWDDLQEQHLSPARLLTMRLVAWVQMPPAIPTGQSSRLHLNSVHLQVFIPVHNHEKPKDFSDDGPRILGLKHDWAKSIPTVTSCTLLPLFQWASRSPRKRRWSHVGLMLLEGLGINRTGSELWMSALFLNKSSSRLWYQW